MAQIVPRDWTVLDFGCSFAPQAFFFVDHKEYVGVDIMTKIEARFSAANTRHFLMSIEEFIAAHSADYDMETAFAICSYVPPWGGDNIGRVRSAFRNVFTFYPADAKAPFLKLAPDILTT